MAYNFLGCDRDQPFLLPPDLRDWLPQGHLAWFILDVVDQLDLQPFHRAHRDDGHGHPAYDPTTLLGVLLYGYCLGVRSSRQRRSSCREDLAFRVLAANQTPDHVTIARFRARHEQALAGFLVESLKLCAAAGMVRVGTVALDGTKLAGNAADTANPTLDKLEAEVAEILRQAAETDQREDRRFGDARGDELPPALASKAGRLARLRQAKAQLEAEATAREQAYQQRVAAHTAAAKAKGTTPRQLKAPAAGGTQPQGGRERHRPRQPPPAHPQRQRAGLQRPGGHHLGAGDRRRRTHRRGQRHPPARPHAGGHRHHAGRRRDRPATRGRARRLRLLVDRQPHRDPQRPRAVHPAGQARPPRQARTDGKPSASKSDGLRAAMQAKPASDEGKARYAKRRETVEPVFGQIKEQQGARRFLRRGRRACTAEWKLVCGTHNLLKLWRHTLTQPATRPATT